MEKVDMVKMVKLIIWIKIFVMDADDWPITLLGSRWM